MGRNNENSLRVAVVGTGGMAREAVAWLRDAHPEAELVGFIDDDQSRRGEQIKGLPVLGGIESAEGSRLRLVVAVGNPSGRRDIVRRLEELQFDLLTVVHPTAYIGDGSRIREGCIICPQVTITTDTRIGGAVIVNYGAQIGHDCVVGPFAFVAPGVNLAGNVTLGEGSYVGIGASVVQGVKVGDWSTVGAGALVLDDVPDGVTVVGVPARSIDRGD